MKRHTLHTILLFFFGSLAVSCGGQKNSGDHWKVTLRVAEDKLLKELSGNNQDPVFNQALHDARMDTTGTHGSFVDLFYKAILKRKPDLHLADYFAAATTREGIKTTSANEEVIEYLNEETKAAIDRTIEILRERLIKFGVHKPGIQFDRATGRILVEFQGDYEPERIKRLLGSNAKLEFYDTYSLNVMAVFLTEADKIIAADTKDTTPLLSLLFSSGLMTQESAMYAIVGYVPIKDTAKLMAMLYRPDVKNILPADVKWAWSAKPPRERNDVLELYALKVTGIQGQDAILNGDVIIDAQRDLDPQSNTYVIAIQMNAQGALDWARITRDASRNPGDKREIAIVLDDLVYTAPTVQSEIPNGNSQITGNFTKSEAADLANILKVGKMPVELSVLSVNDK